MGILPPEVALFEPTPQDIHRGGEPGPPTKSTRCIILNTPLTEAEISALKSFHEAFENVVPGLGKAKGEIPRYISTHALRILNQAKYNTAKALEIMQVHLEMRVKKMPILEGEILGYLKSGMMYVHGRDKKCRPCVIWRLEKMMGLEPMKAARLVLFVLEYVVRYALVPGRVENWVLIVDLQGAGLQHVNNNNRQLAMHVTSLLVDVYCGRNFCTKVLYTPWMVRTVVNSLIPADKRDKVYLVPDKDIKSHLLTLFEPHQLEQKYGGTATDVTDETCYPFRFFPNATGATANWPKPDIPLHHLVDRTFHEGLLWDESTPAAKRAWVASAQGHPLTTISAEYLATKTKQTERPCTTLEQWYDILDVREKAHGFGPWNSGRIRVDDQELESSYCDSDGDEHVIQTPIFTMGGSKQPCSQNESVGINVGTAVVDEHNPQLDRNGETYANTSKDLDNGLQEDNAGQADRWYAEVVFDGQPVQPPAFDERSRDNRLCCSCVFNT